MSPNYHVLESKLLETQAVLVQAFRTYVIPISTDEG